MDTDRPGRDADDFGLRLAWHGGDEEDPAAPVPGGDGVEELPPVALDAPADVGAELAGLRQAVAELQADVVGLRHAVLEWPDLEKLGDDVAALRLDLAQVLEVVSRPGDPARVERLAADRAELLELLRVVRAEVAELKETSSTAPPAPTLPALAPVLEELVALRDEMVLLRRRIMVRAGGAEPARRAERR